MAYELKNESVKSLAGIDFTGNVIPTTWYSWILRDTSWFSKGKGNVLVDINAIEILSEILYWYRPSITRGLDSKNDVIKQKFSGDLLQKSYKQLEDKFGLTTKQIRDGIVTLEKNNLVERVFISIPYGTGIVSNIMYININHEKIIDISSRLPEEKDYDKGYCLVKKNERIDNKKYSKNTKSVSIEPILPTGLNSQHLLTISSTPIDYLVTNTKIPTKTTTENNLSKDNTAKAVAQDEIKTENKKNNKANKENKTHKQSYEETTVNVNTTQKNQSKIANRKIANYCKEQAKNNGISCVAKNNNGIQHFTSNKFKELMEVAGCDDIFCMISKLIEGSVKLGQFSPDISTPQNLYSNASKIYNACVKNGYWESSINPVSQWFEDFYTIYPRREGYAESKERYLRNVREINKHNEIIEGTTEFVKNVGKQNKDINFLLTANNYLEKQRRKDTLKNNLADDSTIFNLAFDSGDIEILREHLKAKYGEDFARNPEMIEIQKYRQESKTKIQTKHIEGSI